MKGFLAKNIWFSGPAVLALALVALGGCHALAARVAYFGLPTNYLSSNAGLLAQYTFDGKEMYQNVSDRSGSGNTAYLLPGSSGVLATSTIGGKLGQALTFDGVDDLATTTSDFLGTNAVSITAWMKMSTLGGGAAGRILGNNQTIFRLSAPNTLTFSSDGGATIANSASAAFATSTWVFVAVTRTSSGTANLYVNGALSGTANQSSGTPANGGYVVMGASPTGGNPFNGSLDDVRVYNRVLTAAEIAVLGQAGTILNASLASSIKSGLVGYWTFDGKNMYNNVADSSGNNNTGYWLVGATSTVTGKLGQALSFNGSSNYISVNANSTLNSWSNAITVSAWVYPIRLTSNFHAVAAQRTGCGGSGNWQMYARTNGAPYLGGVYFNIWDTGSVARECYTSTALALKTWSLLSATYDGSNINLYINGTQVKQCPFTQTMRAASLPTIIGQETCNDYFHGYIDDVRIYNVAMASTTIQYLYQLGTGRLRATAP